MFVRKYFKVLPEKDAYLIFSLYHKMMVQVDNMKSSGHYWANNNGVFTKIGGFLKSSIKNMGVAEVMYRLLLIQFIFFLNKVTGINIGKDLRNWALKGARRGCPTSHSSDSSSDSDSGSNSSGSFGGGRSNASCRSRRSNLSSDRESFGSASPTFSGVRGQSFPELEKSTSKNKIRNQRALAEKRLYKRRRAGFKNLQAQDRRHDKK